MGLVRRLDFTPGRKLLEGFEQVHGEEQTVVGEREEELLGYY